MRFWDASAVLPLCLRESRSRSLRRLAVQDGAVVVWWATSTECYSAFARLRRDAVLTRAQEDQAREVVRQFAAAWTEMLPSEPLREMAARVLLRHPLRAADALQLAAALVWADGRGMRHEFVCVDERLREAAEREGLAVLP